MARHLDDDLVVRTGDGWRRRVLGGRSVAEVIATDVPARRNICFEMTQDQSRVLAHFVIASGMSRAQFCREALRQYLIDHHDLSPEDWPEYVDGRTRS